MSQRAVWIILLLSVMTAAALLAVAGLTVGLTAYYGPASCIAAGLGAGYLCRREPDSWLRRAASALDGMSSLALVALCGSVASYCVARLSHGYVDPMLARADTWFGFDWVAAYRFTFAHPALQLAGKIAYVSIGYSPAVIAVALGLSGRERALRRFVAAFAFCLWLAVAFFPLFPARSALVHLLGNGAYAPSSGMIHVAVIDGLRGPHPTPLDLNALVGLITFPSFHACCAILFMWAGWPMRGLRYLMLVVNAAMLLATPVEETHYLVDVIAGIACAMLAIGLVSKADAVRQVRVRAGRYSVAS